MAKAENIEQSPFFERRAAAGQVVVYGEFVKIHIYAHISTALIQVTVNVNTLYLGITEPWVYALDLFVSKIPVDCYRSFKMQNSLANDDFLTEPPKFDLENYISHYRGISCSYESLLIERAASSINTSPTKVERISIACR